MRLIILILPAFIFKTEQTCKPGSVLDDHLSTHTVTGMFKPYTEKRRASLIFPKLLRIGFTREFSYHLPCALLPHISTLTSQRKRLFSVALSLESPPPAVSRYPALRSPDFPQLHMPPRPSGLLICLLYIILRFMSIFFFYFIFCLCCKSPADMTLSLIYLQNLLYLTIKRRFYSY